MNVTNATQYQQLGTALILILVGCVAGYAVSETNISATPEKIEFDQFSFKALEVDSLMQGAFNNPSEDNLRTVNNKLAIGLQNWADRHTGENKETFVAYLGSCQIVIDEMQAGHDVMEEKEEMYELYGKLRNE